jgi:hypothetical protein
MLRDAVMFKLAYSYGLFFRVQTRAAAWFSEFAQLGSW